MADGDIERASEVIVHADAEDLIDRTARRLVDRIVELQADGRRAQWCLSGGRVANRVYARMAELVPDSALDAGALELWWGDEGFVPTSDPERNAGEALGVLAGRLRIDPALAHPMPAAAGTVTLEVAASNYATELGNRAFDICLLGLGEDGHVAGLFPDHPSSAPTTATVLAVTDAPKAPANRLTLTLNAINRSSEVWFLVSGADKAEAVAGAFSGDHRLPATNVSGTERTVWLVDESAASRLADRGGPDQ